MLFSSIFVGHTNEDSVYVQKGTRFVDIKSIVANKILIVRINKQMGMSNQIGKITAHFIHFGSIALVLIIFESAVVYLFSVGFGKNNWNKCHQSSIPYWFCQFLSHQRDDYEIRDMYNFMCRLKMDRVNWLKIKNGFRTNDSNAIYSAYGGIRVAKKESQIPFGDLMLKQCVRGWFFEPSESKWIVVWD